MKISNGGVVLTDEFGSESGIQLELMLGTAVRLEFDLRGEPESVNGKLSIFPAVETGSVSHYFAIDTGNANSSSPALLRYHDVDLSCDEDGHNIVSVGLANNAAEKIIEALQNKELAVFRAEIGGIGADGQALFAWQFDIVIRSRVYLGHGDETIISDPAYYTALQVDAIINAAHAETDENIRLNSEAAARHEAALTAQGNRIGKLENDLLQLDNRISAIQNELEEI